MDKKLYDQTIKKLAPKLLAKQYDFSIPAQTSFRGWKAMGILSVVFAD